MRDLEEHLNSSRDEFHTLLANMPVVPAASLKRRLRRRQLRRNGFGAAVLVGGMVLGVRLIPSPTNNVDATNSVPTTDVSMPDEDDSSSTTVAAQPSDSKRSDSERSDSERSQAESEAESDNVNVPESRRLVTIEVANLTQAEVADGLQSHLGNGSTLLPVEPVSMEQLEAILQQHLLRWPSVLWEGPSEPLDPTGQRMLSASRPEDDRVIHFLVKGKDNAWFVSGVFPTSFTDVDAGFDSDTATVEVVRSDSTAPPVFYDTRALWEAVTIPMESVDAIEPMAYLSVGRDGLGQATMIEGWAIEVPVGLGPAIDSFGPSRPLSDFSDFFVSRVLELAEGDVTEQYDRYYRFPDVKTENAETASEVYFYTRDSQDEVCISVVDDTGAAGSCIPSAFFNQQGIAISGGRLDGEGWLVWVLPDTIELGDLGDAEVDPSGRMFFSTTNGRSDFGVIDGVFSLR